MIVKTELKNLRIEHDGALFVMRQMSTAELTDIAIIGKDEGPGRAVEETFIITVREWDNVEDINGPLECNEVNKRKVFASNPELIDAVLTKFEAQKEKEEKEEKKISNCGPSGTSTPVVSVVKSANP